jgi:hypothetical protein
MCQLGILIVHKADNNKLKSASERTRNKMIIQMMSARTHSKLNYNKDQLISILRSK